MAKNKCIFTHQAAIKLNSKLIEPLSKHYKDNQIPCYAFKCGDKLFYFGEHIKHPEYLEIVFQEADGMRYKVNVLTEDIVDGMCDAESITREFGNAIERVKEIEKLKGSESLDFGVNGKDIEACYYCNFPLINPPIYGQCPSCNSRNIKHYKTGQDS